MRPTKNNLEATIAKSKLLCKSKVVFLANKKLKSHNSEKLLLILRSKTNSSLKSNKIDSGYYLRLSNRTFHYFFF